MDEYISYLTDFYRTYRKDRNTEDAILMLIFVIVISIVFVIPVFAKVILITASCIICFFIFNIRNKKINSQIDDLKGKITAPIELKKERTVPCIKVDLGNQVSLTVFLRTGVIRYTNGKVIREINGKYTNHIVSH